MKISIYPNCYNIIKTCWFKFTYYCLLRLLTFLMNIDGECVISPSMRISLSKNLLSRNLISKGAGLQHTIEDYVTKY